MRSRILWKTDSHPERCGGILKPDWWQQQYPLWRQSYRPWSAPKRLRKPRPRHKAARSRSRGSRTAYDFSQSVPRRRNHPDRRESHQCKKDNRMQLCMHGFVQWGRCTWGNGQTYQMEESINELRKKSESVFINRVYDRIKPGTNRNQDVPTLQKEITA